MQLKVKQILEIIKDLKKQGMSQKEINELPVYIGDDDELNGIHTAWYCDYIKDGDTAFIELIEENSSNVDFTGKAILIS